MPDDNQNNSNPRDAFFRGFSQPGEVNVNLAKGDDEFTAEMRERKTPTGIDQETAKPVMPLEPAETKTSPSSQPLQEKKEAVEDPFDQLDKEKETKKEPEEVKEPAKSTAPETAIPKFADVVSKTPPPKPTFKKPTTKKPREPINPKGFFVFTIGGLILGGILAAGGYFGLGYYYDLQNEEKNENIASLEKELAALEKDPSPLELPPEEIPESTAPPVEPQVTPPPVVEEEPEPEPIPTPAPAPQPVPPAPEVQRG